jgi:hypothetical protein
MPSGYQVQTLALLQIPRMRDPHWELDLLCAGKTAAGSCRELRGAGFAGWGLRTGSPQGNAALLTRPRQGPDEEDRHFQVPLRLRFGIEQEDRRSSVKGAARTSRTMIQPQNQYGKNLDPHKAKSALDPAAVTL